MGVHLMPENAAGRGWSKPPTAIRVSLDRQRAITVDAVVAAAGPAPGNVAGAPRRTADLTAVLWSIASCKPATPAIYALGDCAEINGVVLPFLQPILLSAMCLSKNLLAQAGELKLPPMLVKVKNPGSAAASGRRHPPRRI
ncbi:FAD-dependent pyridine nucleotide-disulfide oxidoreductase [Klebsiella pneumoniae subsp. ozaenae]|uniref:FAD-dependent pyridine nucleotide-disulfide oxidoreductase n=1 Tax=Klebsiella pneumoniae subsp. ozaenae TaxID=574 RepID=A0A377Z9Y3_KLEPO|nr:FAD-dependent pyridine nucleotide-disulfide oxidoreductase [Klebsiella pneumoniae subsp. ozaenae]